MGWNITVKKYIEDALPAGMLKMMKGMPAPMMKMVRMDNLGMRINTGGYVEYKEKGGSHGHLNQGAERKCGKRRLGKLRKLHVPYVYLEARQQN